jgi:hypothetical protein
MHQIGFYPCGDLLLLWFWEAEFRAITAELRVNFKQNIPPTKRPKKTSVFFGQINPL